MPIRRGVEVTGFVQDDDGVDVHLADGEPLRAAYLVGADGGRSVVRKAAGIEFVGPDATRSHLIAEVEVTEETPTGVRHDDVGHPRTARDGGRADGAGGGDRAAARSGDRADAGGPQRGADGRVRHRLRRPQPDLDLAVHRRHPAGGRLPRRAGAARRRRRAHPSARRAGRGSASASRTRSTSAGSSPRWSRASRPTPCWTPTTPSGTRPPPASLKNTMAQSVLQRADAANRGAARPDRRAAGFDGPRRPLAGLISGLDVAYDLGEGHPLLGRRMPDLDLVTPDGPRRVFDAAPRRAPGAAQPRRARQRRHQRRGRTGSSSSTPTTTGRGSCR